MLRQDFPNAEKREKRRLDGAGYRRKPSRLHWARRCRDPHRPTGAAASSVPRERVGIVGIDQHPVSCPKRTVARVRSTVIPTSRWIFSPCARRGGGERQLVRHRSERGQSIDEGVGHQAADRNDRAGAEANIVVIDLSGRGTLRMGRRSESGSLQTQCWKRQDSNCSSHPARGRVRFPALPCGESPFIFTEEQGRASIRVPAQAYMDH